MVAEISGKTRFDLAVVLKASAKTIDDYFFNFFLPRRSPDKENMFVIVLPKFSFYRLT